MVGAPIHVICSSAMALSFCLASATCCGVASAVAPISHRLLAILCSDGGVVGVLGEVWVAGEDEGLGGRLFTELGQRIHPEPAVIRRPGGELVPVRIGRGLCHSGALRVPDVIPVEVHAV